MTEQEFQVELEKRVQNTEEVIRRYLPAEEGYARRVMEAMNYSVLAGGKRLRPLFLAETAAPSSHAHGGDLPSVWRDGKGSRALYGSHGDDSHLLSGA